MGAVKVSVDNFERAETAKMFDGTLQITGGINELFHFRGPTPIDKQTVIRMNRDTLYSAAIVDISQGATLTLPETDGRYLTIMVVNEDHYINKVLSAPGEHSITMDEYDTPFVDLAVRILVDPSDPDDVATVNALQDAIVLKAASSKPYEHPDYDQDSLDETRELLLALSKGLPDARDHFGRREDVDPIRHMTGTAAGWGGLPENEAFYYIETAPIQVGQFKMSLKDVPVDAFWSVTVYNRDGYLEENEYGSYSVNSVTAQRDDDGSVTVNLAPEKGDLSNYLYVMDGWNYALRLYRPRTEILDGSWVPPKPEPI